MRCAVFGGPLGIGNYCRWRLGGRDVLGGHAVTAGRWAGRRAFEALAADRKLGDDGAALAADVARASLADDIGVRVLGAAAHGAASVRQRRALLALGLAGLAVAVQDHV